MLRALILTLIVAATSVQAHSKLSTSTPADGAVVASAPTRVSMQFNKPLRLASVVMTGPNGQATPLELNADAGFETEVELVSPDRGVGDYTVIWQGFSKDGHLLKGTFKFEVK